LSPKAPSPTKRETGPCEGFCEHAGQRWIYPNNLPIRGYQKAAVELALFNNAMIVLPTGFGKTFIAAVVMYNFYRWYPMGKVIFVAPTKPLVAQQIIECKKISGIPKADCIEATGAISVERRRAYWTEKRVIFATPQVIENDLENDVLDAESVRCIVIDEAHRAQGGYAYVNIVNQLQSKNPGGFRVLALSATPGSDIQRVQQVMQNLLINEVMFRSENSIDLMQYRNDKSTRAWTVELVGKHKAFVDRFIAMTKPIFKELHRAGLTYNGDSIERVAKYTLIKAMQGANNNQLERGTSSRGKLKFLCAAALSLSSKFELLTLYGIRVFYSNITRGMAETRAPIKTALAGKIEYDKMIEEMKALFGEDIEPDPDKKAKADLLQGHPKLIVVKDLLMQHFKENEGKQETRAIVFTKYRESVYDIVQTMKAYDPIIKPAAFVGQGSGSKSNISGMKQREQIELVQRFKAGDFNVLVATCVAEEGLDIGEVDLIICYDTSSSPISTTQRRGRTGRKRSGNVQTICTKGYEEKRLQKAGASRRQVEDQLFKKENYTAYRYHNAPRMVPEKIIPVCMEHKVYPPDNDDEEEEPAPKKKRARKTKDNDETGMKDLVSSGFVTATKLRKKKLDFEGDEKAAKDHEQSIKKAYKATKSDTSKATDDAFSDDDDTMTGDVTLVSETPDSKNAQGGNSFNTSNPVIVDDDEETWDDLWTLPPDLPKFD